MADALHRELAAQSRHDVVRREAGGLVEKQHTFNFLGLSEHGRRIFSHVIEPRASAP